MKHETTAPNPFLMIRATIEAEIPAPGVLTVSSALPRDGKTGVTSGLVRSLAAAGYTTLAVDAGAEHAERGQRRCGHRDASGIRAFARCGLRLRLDRTGASAHGLGRRRCGVFCNRSLALRLRGDRCGRDQRRRPCVRARGRRRGARTTRRPRREHEADRETVELFGRLNVRFIGVIATHEEGRYDPAASSLLERLQPRALTAGRRVPVVVSDEPARGTAAAAYRSAV